MYEGILLCRTVTELLRQEKWKVIPEKEMIPIPDQEPQVPTQETRD